MGTHVQYTKLPVDQYPYVREFPRPIELFGNRDYQGYHVRGQIFKFPYESFGPPLDESIIYHQLQLVVLVSASYKNAQTESLQDYYKFGKIIGRTRADFDSIKPSLISKAYPINGKAVEPEKLPSPVIVNINDIDIVENDYLKGCLSRKQDIILVSLDMPAILKVDPKTDRRIKGRLFYSHSFLAHYFGLPGLYAQDVRTWFSNLYDTFVFELDYKGISKKEFFRLLDVVGKFSEWAIGK